MIWLISSLLKYGNENNGNKVRNKDTFIDRAYLYAPIFNREILLNDGNKASEKFKPRIEAAFPQNKT